MRTVVLHQDKITIIIHPNKMDIEEYIMETFDDCNNLSYQSYKDEVSIRPKTICIDACKKILP